jgi:hypothetical protein
MSRAFFVFTDLVHDVHGEAIAGDETHAGTHETNVVGERLHFHTSEVDLVSMKLIEKIGWSTP